MIKCDIKVGDIVQTMDTLMVKMFDDRECPVKLKYVKAVFDNYKSK